MKVIIDTDPGHDDALALMLACKSNVFEILAITTVAGNSTIENTTRNAQFILDAIGRKDIPIYSGASKPLKRELVQAFVHGKSGLAGVDPKNSAKLTNDAVGQIIRLVQDNPGEVTIVCLGPLTNVAKAIERKPSVMNKVQQIVAMGGAISVAGNMSRVAEFNVFVDPEAADIVLRLNDAPKTLVPLDACNRVKMSLDDFERINDEKLRSLIVRMMQPYIKNIYKDTGINTALMYDPLTIFSLIRPESCISRLFNLQIETKGLLTRGMTIVDKRQITDGLKPNVKVITEIKAADFVTEFISTLNS